MTRIDCCTIFIPQVLRLKFVGFLIARWKLPMKFAGFLCFAAAFGIADAQQLQGNTWQFLALGTTHSGESPLKPGEGWLALRKENGGWVLTKTTVKAKKVESVITEYDIKISSKHNDAIALFRSPLISDGPVLTPSGTDKKLPMSFIKRDDKLPSVKVVFNGKAYGFAVGKRKRIGSSKSETEFFDFPVIVRSGDQSTNIGESGNSDQEGSTNVIWMGDLDNDGKLDLIINTSGANSSGLCVLLSSTAKGKQLFGPELCHIGSGC